MLIYNDIKSKAILFSMALELALKLAQKILSFQYEVSLL